MTPAESVATTNASSSSSQGNKKPVGIPVTNQPENAVTPTLQSASQAIRTPAPELVPTALTTRTEKLVIVIKVKKPTWVSITADGKLVLKGVLMWGKKIQAYSQVVLTTNSAGALAVWWNGNPLPPLGEQDQQATVTFSAAGVTHAFAGSSETGEADSEGLPHVSGGLDRQESTRDYIQGPQVPRSAGTPPDKTKTRKEGEE